ncbi:MAG TPA: signal peptidase II [Vicinamibacteria bacterium]
MSDARGLRAPYVWIMAAIVVSDQVTKLVVDRWMALHESLDVVDGFLRLTYVRNRGAAFGILSDAELPYQAGLFALLSLGALGAIAVYAWRLPAESRLPKTALALIMGGAVGNLIDRVRLGYVIDFVDAYIGPHHWPAFNVADSAISVGVVLLILDMLRRPEPDRAAGGRAAASVPAATPGGD